MNGGCKMFDQKSKQLIGQKPDGHEGVLENPHQNGAKFVHIATHCGSVIFRYIHKKRKLLYLELNHQVLRLNNLDFLFCPRIQAKL